MAAVRDHAGPREVRLFVLHANTDALRFYEREGFVARVLDMALPAPD
jgi:ribosomal protein S18 acetylase RimI-like enzyme